MIPRKNHLITPDVFSFSTTLGDPNKHTSNIQNKGTFQ